MSLTIIAWIGGAILALYLLPLILAVLAVRSATVAVPRFAEVDAAWLDADWLEAARPAIEQLGQCGFVLRTYLDGMSPRTEPLGMRFAAVLVNEETGDMAQVAVMHRLTDDGAIELASATILSFRLGPKRVGTTNGDFPGVFVYPRSHVGNAFPMLRNAATLYRAHRAICARHIGDGKRGEVVPRGSEVKQLTRESADDFGYQVRHGMLSATAAGGYERTWRGTIYGVWKLHPRFIAWHRRRMQEKGLRTLAALGIEPDPVPEVARHELSPGMQAFIDEACEESNAATTRLHTEFQLHQATGFDADMTAGTVKFNLADGRLVVGEFQVLGTWARKASWEWAWNNPNVADTVKPDADRIREFGEQNEIEYLSAGFVIAPALEVAAYFAAIATKVIDAGPVVPLPPDANAEVVAFVALRNLRIVQPNAA